MLKDIYEALRAGKGWEKTLFVVTYDDYGGFCECILLYSGNSRLFTACY